MVGIKRILSCFSSMLHCRRRLKNHSILKSNKMNAFLLDSEVNFVQKIVADTFLTHNFTHLYCLHSLRKFRPVLSACSCRHLSAAKCDYPHFQNSESHRCCAQSWGTWPTVAAGVCPPWERRLTVGVRSLEKRPCSAVCRAGSLPRVGLKQPNECGSYALCGKWIFYLRWEWLKSVNAPAENWPSTQSEHQAPRSS